MSTETHRIRGNGKEELSAKFHDTQKSLSEAAHKMKDTATTAGDQMINELKAQTEELRKKSSEYIKKKPLVALGGAALAGFVLALLMRR